MKKIEFSKTKPKEKKTKLQKFDFIFPQQNFYSTFDLTSAFQKIYIKYNENKKNYQVLERNTKKNADK